MTAAMVNPEGQVSLPPAARAALHVGVVDHVDVEVLADGVVLLRGRDPDQVWYWTEEWQAGEREADADLAAGRSVVPGSEEEFDAYLRGRSAADAPA